MSAKVCQSYGRGRHTRFTNSYSVRRILTSHSPQVLALFRLLSPRAAPGSVQGHPPALSPPTTNRQYSPSARPGCTAWHPRHISSSPGLSQRCSWSGQPARTIVRASVAGDAQRAVPPESREAWKHEAGRPVSMTESQEVLTWKGVATVRSGAVGEPPRGPPCSSACNFY
ncbi:hypothetical protein FA95DRAFT_826017 [Auriscalpium vulgare]|uniref:Uncharacterized protein n=1 Tax=Auriscalpium vulgare TaxID=40419 RepID=A0ACB8RAV4_9AGAM|nr:hypothetical protein FA95DRAFT_826017 [Auriscalpium vulgare]